MHFSCIRYNGLKHYPPLLQTVHVFIFKIPKNFLLLVDVSLTVHHSIELFSSTNFNPQFFINNMLLHYYPQHVSGINMPIFRRKDCIHTASGIFALCTQVVYGADVTESEDTRCCVYTVFPPEDGHVNARNMSRIIV
jgi:hypothetical protein